ncbi:MAG: DoxX family membrane protein [Sporocytophaga sp.]|nr:DoxX family membrane protein [Sporocytophaga sp.]
MKIATITVRILLGLLMAVSGAVVLFNLVEQPEIPAGPLKTFTDGMAASGYLFPLIKIVELVCGLALITGFFVPLATAILFPVSVNILLCHLFIAPEGLPVAIIVVLANLFLAYAHRKNYEPILAMR